MANRIFSFVPPVGPPEVDVKRPDLPSLSASGAEGRNEPVIIGVAGGSASGKTSFCKKIMEALGQNDLPATERRVVIISQDSFYRTLNEEECVLVAKGHFNFDHPDAHDNDLMKQSLRDLLMRKQVDIPVYDFKMGARSKTEKTRIYKADVILFEGIFALYHNEIRDMMAVKLFIDADSDTRLVRRLRRDVQERARTFDETLEMYTKFAKSGFEDFTLPTKKYADVVIPTGAMNDVAVNLIVLYVKNILEAGMKTGAPAKLA